MIPVGLNSKIVTLSNHYKIKFFMEDIGTTELSVDLKVNITGIKERIFNTVSLLIDKETFYTALFNQKQIGFYSKTQETLQKILT